MPREKTTRSGGVPLKNFTKNWWPETMKLYNMLHYELTRTNTSIRDCQFVYYSQTDTELWMSEHPWKKERIRYFMEIALQWIKIYGVLSKSLTREDFLKHFNIDPKEVNNYMRREGFNRKKSFPVIAERFNKTLNK